MKASSRTKVGLAIAASVAVGILLGSTVFANILSGATSGIQRQGVAITGTETIKVFGPSGKFVAEWQGADPLTTYGVNALVGCITGTSTTPDEFASCDSWTNDIEIAHDSPDGPCILTSGNCWTAIQSATNTLSPQGCSPTRSAVSTPLCSGWVTESIFGPSTFTTGNCGSSCGIEAVLVYAAASSGGFATYGAGLFDELCTTIYAPSSNTLDCTLGAGAIPPVSPGDTLVVTIAFSVS